MGVRVPVGDGNFSPYHRVQTGSRAHSASYPMVSGALSLGVKPTTHLYLVPRSSMRGSIPPLPILLHGVVLS